MKIIKVLFGNKTTVFGFILMLFISIIAIFAPFISPYNPNSQNMLEKFEPPSKAHILGTDKYGRDLFSRTLYGARTSLLTGFLSVLISITIGTIAGMFCAYKGGFWDAGLVGIIDIMMTFPTLLLGILVLAILGGGRWMATLAIAIAFTPRLARVARGSALEVTEATYIESAEALGASDLRLLSKHVLPNIFSPISVVGTLWVGTAIRTAAGLNFLGLGVSPPTPSWGGIVRMGVNNIMVAPWIAQYGGLAILLAILGFNLLGDGLRDIADPRMRG